MNKMPYPNGTPGYQASIYSAWTLWLVGLVWLAASVGCADEPAHKSEAHPHTQVLTSDQPKQHKDGSSSSAPLSFTRSRIEYRLPGVALTLGFGGRYRREATRISALQGGECQRIHNISHNP